LRVRRVRKVERRRINREERKQREARERRMRDFEGVAKKERRTKSQRLLSGAAVGTLVLFGYARRIMKQSASRASHESDPHDSDSPES
jgi:hypothetical protein